MILLNPSAERCERAGEVRTRRSAPASPLRLGVVGYLNMVPLVSGLDEAFGDRGLTLRDGHPSQVAAWLERGEVDAGMVPVAEFLRHPQWRILRPASGPGSMIGARGDVLSVLVLGRGRLDQWRRLRPDAHSRSSNALSRVILECKHGLQLETAEPVPMGDWSPDATCDEATAIVLIGSRALRWGRRLAAEGWTVLDLGGEWCAWTGLPFVFAAWTMRPGVELDGWAELFEEQKRLNFTRLGELATGWSGLAYDRLTPAEAEDYLRNNVAYDLDDDAMRAIELFRAEGSSLGFF